MYQISSVRHMYPEPAGFLIDRRSGHRHYTFLHFHNAVRLRVGEREFDCQPHAMVLIRPGVPQYFYSSEPLLHDWFHFSGDPENLPLSRFVPDAVCYPASHGFVTGLVATLESAFFEGSESGRCLIDCKIRELFLTLDRELAGSAMGQVRGETLEKFRFLRGEMLANLGQHHKVEVLSARVGLSPSRFFALYRKIYGTSPVEDQIIARINAAKNRLAFSTLSVEALSAELGYENTTHFIRQFKSRVGMTPTEYRRSQKREEE